MMEREERLEYVRYGGKKEGDAVEMRGRGDMKARGGENERGECNMKGIMEGECEEKMKSVWE